MRSFSKTVRITAIITVISFLITLIIHYCFKGEEANFWSNVSLAIFGSSLLTCISAYIGYFAEKRRVLESFGYATRTLLRAINKYDNNWDVERKVDFFLEYDSIDKTYWDQQLGEIFFLHDPCRNNFKYIYQKIYKPLLDFNQAVSNHQFHFRYHKDGSGKNDAVMKVFTDELEKIVIERTVSIQELDDGQKFEIPSVRNRLVFNIQEELNGRYYNIMYNHKAQKESET